MGHESYPPPHHSFIVIAPMIMKFRAGMNVIAPMIMKFRTGMNVIAPMIMKFRTGMKLDVFYTDLAEILCLYFLVLISNIKLDFTFENF